MGERQGSFSILNFGAIVLLMLSTLYLAITGFLMDWLGLHRVAFHNYVGYAWVGLALLHLGLSWGQMSAYWRHQFRLGPPHEPTHLPSLPPVGRRRWLSSTATFIGGFLLGLFWPFKQAVPTVQQQGDVGLTYHQWSKIGLTQAGSALFPWGQQPDRYKTYPEAVSISLPRPEAQPQTPFQAVLRHRRSRRSYTGESISLEQLSCLLAMTPPPENRACALQCTRLKQVRCWAEPVAPQPDSDPRPASVGDWSG